MSEPTAWERYHQTLLDLHAKAGAPSSREIARRSGSNLSHTTANQILRGKRLPGRVILRKFLIGVGVPKEQHAYVLELWRATYQELAGSLLSEPPTVSHPPLATADALILAELQAIRALLEKIARSGYDT